MFKSLISLLLDVTHLPLLDKIKIDFYSSFRLNTLSTAAYKLLQSIKPKIILFTQYKCKISF